MVPIHSPLSSSSKNVQARTEQELGWPGWTHSIHVYLQNQWRPLSVQIRSCIPGDWASSISESHNTETPQSCGSDFPKHHGNAIESGCKWNFSISFNNGCFNMSTLTATQNLNQGLKKYGLRINHCDPLQIYVGINWFKIRGHTPKSEKCTSCSCGILPVVLLSRNIALSQDFLCLPFQGSHNLKRDTHLVFCRHLTAILKDGSWLCACSHA